MEKNELSNGVKNVKTSKKGSKDKKDKKDKKSKKSKSDKKQKGSKNNSESENKNQRSRTSPFPTSCDWCSKTFDVSANNVLIMRCNHSFHLECFQQNSDARATECLECDPRSRVLMPLIGSTTLYKSLSSFGNNPTTDTVDESRSVISYMIGKDRITNSRIKSTMHHRERRLPKLDMVQYPPILMNSIGRNVSNDMEGIATSNNNNKRGINRKKVRSIKESVRDADDEKRDSDKNKEGEDNANNSDKENNDDDDSDSDETSGSDSDASGGKRNRSRSRSSSSSSSSGSNHNGSESSESEDDKDAKKERKNDNDDTNSSSSSSSDNEDDDDNDKPRNVVQAPAVERNSSWLSLIHRSSGSATVEPDFKSAIKYGVPASVLVHIGLDKTSAILCGINILDLVRKGYIMDDLIVMGISLPDAIKMGLSTYKAFNECKRSIPISEMVTYWKLTCRDLLTHICNNRGPLYLKLDLTVEEHKLLGTSLKLLLKRKVTREMLITYQPIKLNQWKEVTGEELPF